MFVGNSLVIFCFSHLLSMPSNTKLFDAHKQLIKATAFSQLIISQLFVGKRMVLFFFSTVDCRTPATDNQKRVTVNDTRKCCVGDFWAYCDGKICARTEKSIKSIQFNGWFVNISAHNGRRQLFFNLFAIFYSFCNVLFVVSTRQCDCSLEFVYKYCRTRRTLVQMLFIYFDVILQCSWLASTKLQNNV